MLRHSTRRAYADLSEGRGVMDHTDRGRLRGDVRVEPVELRVRQQR
ncbi:hypothetical protein [Streptomyces albidus (ex Kaewkla and Franco 2022)]|nr:hypothetical protein [Streptomyces albidus (ex Kaewkla and Franco 2022)]